MTVTLKLSRIRTDGGTQLRAETNQETIQDYAQALLSGDIFPPVDVYQEGMDVWLADGFHRYLATQLAGIDEIEAEVHQGTRRDAFLHAAETNRKHGLQFTNKDKHRIVTLFLHDPEWSEWSDREIAKRCGVSQPFVSKLRKEMSDNRYHSEENNDLSEEKNIEQFARLFFLHIVTAGQMLAEMEEIFLESGTKEEYWEKWCTHIGISSSLAASYLTVYDEVKGNPDKSPQQLVPGLAIQLTIIFGFLFQQCSEKALEGICWYTGWLHGIALLREGRVLDVPPDQQQEMLLEAEEGLQMIQKEIATRQTEDATVFVSFMR